NYPSEENSLDCGPRQTSCHGPIDCGGCGAGLVCLITNSCCQPRCPLFNGQCGLLDDSCGGTIHCSCPRGQTRVTGTCCVLRTCSQLVTQCGSLSDGCGGTINCACPSGQICRNGNCCIPVTTCGPGQCGLVPDGCGGTINCGNPCSAGQSCGVDH